MAKIDLSVIIPAYNVKDYVVRAISSALSQKGLEIEVVVVNDGSTDGTGEVVRKEFSCDSRVKLYDQENMGLYRTRTNGIKYSNGRYLTFIDADDYIDADFYRDLVEKMDIEKLDVVEFGYRKVTEVGTEYCVAYQPEYRDRVDAARKVILKHNSSCSNCNKIYQAKVMQSCSFDEGVFQQEEDMLLNLKVLAKIGKYYVSNKVGYNYFTREGSITTSRWKLGDFGCLDTWNCIFDFVKNEFPEVLDVCAMTYCSRIAYYYCMTYKTDKGFTGLEELSRRFKDIYRQNKLSGYSFSYESRNRRMMVGLFRIHPHLAAFFFPKKHLKEV